MSWRSREPPKEPKGGPHLLPLAITTGAYAVTPLLSQALSKALRVYFTYPWRLHYLNRN